MRKLWSLITLVGGLANAAAAESWSEGPCDDSPTPTPVGPDISLDQMQDYVGGSAFQLTPIPSNENPSSSIENDVAGFLCGWEVEGERLCVVAFSQAGAGGGAYLALDLYLESSILASLESGALPGAPTKRLLSDVPQAHAWRNGMKLADVTNDGCDDLLVSVQAQDSVGNETLSLYIIPGDCAAGSAGSSALSSGPCSLTGGGGDATLPEIAEECGGATLSISVFKKSVSATSAWDVVTLKSGSNGSLQQHLVLPNHAEACAEGADEHGTFELYSALTDLSGGIPPPVLCLEGSLARLEQAQVRAINTQDGAGGLLIVGGGDSNGTSLVTVLPAQTLEEALFNGTSSLDLMKCDTCAKSDKEVRGSVQDTHVVTRVVSTGECADTPCTVSFFAAISDKNLTLGTWSSSTPKVLSLRDIALNGDEHPSLSFTSDDMDRDGWPELWIAPVGMLPTYQQAGATAAPNAVGLLLSTRLIESTVIEPITHQTRTDVTPAPGVRVYVSGETSAPLLLASGHLQRKPDELPFELIGFGQDDQPDIEVSGVPSSLHLWTGLDRLFDRDGDGVIGSNVPLQAAQWTASEAVSSIPLPGGDCNDHDITIASRKLEVCETDVDEDCLDNGHLGCDADGDGVGYCRDCNDETPGDTYVIGESLSCNPPSCSSLGNREAAPSSPLGAFLLLLACLRTRSGKFQKIISSLHNKI